MKNNKLLSNLKIGSGKSNFGKSHFKALLSSFKNELSAERPRPQQIL